MDIDDDTSSRWRRSSRCAGGDCLEVLIAGDSVSVRDSKDLAVGTLRFSRDEWAEFVGSIRAGILELG
jgi:hypothetical protein